MIRILNATKHFGNKVAVDGLALEVAPAEVVGLLGPNGAGKTTTIKMVAGLLRPTSGRVEVCGFDVVKQSIQAKRRTSFVPDQPYLYEKLSGREMLAFVGKVYDMPDEQIAAQIEHWIDTFEMADYIDELAESYSHGMKQRVVMSAAFMHDAKAIVIDEPMVGLDPKSARTVKDLIRRAAAEGGAAVLLCTHSLDIAEECADRIAIMQNGRLVATGTLDDLRETARTSGRLEEAFLAITEKPCAQVVTTQDSGADV